MNQIKLFIQQKNIVINNLSLNFIYVYLCSLHPFNKNALYLACFMTSDKAAFHYHICPGISLIAFCPSFTK